MAVSATSCRDAEDVGTLVTPFEALSENCRQDEASHTTTPKRNQSATRALKRLFYRGQCGLRSGLGCLLVSVWYPAQEICLQHHHGARGQGVTVFAVAYCRPHELQLQEYFMRCQIWAASGRWLRR